MQALYNQNVVFFKFFLLINFIKNLKSFLCQIKHQVTYMVSIPILNQIFRYHGLKLHLLATGRSQGSPDPVYFHPLE